MSDWREKEKGLNDHTGDWTVMDSWKMLREFIEENEDEFMEFLEENTDWEPGDYESHLDSIEEEVCG